jgi:hypothetical protein
MNDFIEILRGDERFTVVRVLAPCTVAWTTDGESYHAMVHNAKPGMDILDWDSPRGARRGYSATLTNPTQHFAPEGEGCPDVEPEAS